MIPSQLNPGESADGPSQALTEEKNLPIGIGDSGEDLSALDPLSTSGTRRKFNAGSLVIVGVIVIAIGGLWSMRKLTKVGAASIGNREVELTIEKFLGALTGESGKTSAQPAANLPDGQVLDVLKESYTERQVPLTSVQRNPFILYGETFVTSTTGDNPDQNTAAKLRQRTERQEAYQRGAAGLHLKSVIMGAEPLANINGKIVRVGDEIVANPESIAFRVSKIAADAVTVVGEDPSLDLTVEVVLTIKRFN